MKIKSLLLFALLFWLLGVCTVLSGKIQEEMTPQVTTIQASPQQISDPNSKMKLPLGCLQEDENGMHLYRLSEGSGWEAGTFVEEVQGYLVTEDALLLETAGGQYVRYTSKPLAPGEPVEAAQNEAPAPDRWLAVFPGDVPELGPLPPGVALEEKQGNAVLLAVDLGSSPFMEGQAKSLLPPLAQAKIYSFAEMERFLGNGICGGLLLGAFLMGLALWGYAWYQGKDLKKYCGCMAANLLLGGALLGGMALILSSVDLPSSLLPQQYITDFTCYQQEFQEFFGALKLFSQDPGSASGAAVSEMLSQRVYAGFWCSSIAILSFGLSGLFLFGEEILLTSLAVRRLRREIRENFHLYLQ